MDSFDLRLWEGFLASGGDTTQNAMVDQIVIDSRRIDSQKSLFVALPGKQNDGHQFVNAAIKAGCKFALVKHDFILSEQLPSHVQLLRAANPLKAFQEIARAYRLTKKATVIAITGSFGKTMVKDLLHAFLSTSKKTISSPESFNSQIGVALSLLNIQEQHEIAIIEAAVSEKNEMDTLSFMIQPECSILTHVGKKHQTTLVDLETTVYEMMKMTVCESVIEWALIPNDLNLEPYHMDITCPYYFWNEKDAILPHAKLKSFENSSKMHYEIDFSDFKFKGATTSGFNYFLDLINIAVKAAFLENIPKENICKVLKNFMLEPMRTELFQSTLGTTFINDIYCQDPQSIDLSLKYFEQASVNHYKTFMFSGMKEKSPQNDETDYKRIGQAIVKANLQELMLIGSHPFSPLIQEVAKNSPKTKISLHNTMEEAIKKLQNQIRPEDFVLIKGEKKEFLDHLTKAFDGSISNNQCTVNLAAVQSNLNAFRAKLPEKTRIMVMVKALAYGTSDIQMAKFLKTENIDILGVSYVDEAVSLKKASVSQDIFVLNAGLHEISKVIEWDLEVGVSDLKFIQELEKEAALKNKKIKTHLHVNTGMNRFGCLPENALGLAKAIIASPHLILDGIMTHFAAADSANEDAFTRNQVKIFTDTIDEISSHGIEIPWAHACNSSACMRFSFPQFNMARIGLAVYGLYPSIDAEKALELKLALSLTSRIVGINECKIGDTISYGRTYKVNENDQKIAVLPIGYFDGLHRNYSGKGYVVIGGKKAPMVGKICMDYMMVDVSDIKDVQIGDKVLIFGEDEYGNYLPPEEFAASGNSIVYELITCLGPRIKRVFIFEESMSYR